MCEFAWFYDRNLLPSQFDAYYYRIKEWKETTIYNNWY